MGTEGCIRLVCVRFMLFRFVWLCRGVFANYHCCSHLGRFAVLLPPAQSSFMCVRACVLCVCACGLLLLPHRRVLLPCRGSGVAAAGVRGPCDRGGRAVRQPCAVLALRSHRSHCWWYRGDPCAQVGTATDERSPPPSLHTHTHSSRLCTGGWDARHPVTRGVSRLAATKPPPPRACSLYST